MSLGQQQEPEIQQTESAEQAAELELLVARLANWIGFDLASDSLEGDNRWRTIKDLLLKTYEFAPRSAEDNARLLDIADDLFAALNGHSNGSLADWAALASKCCARFREFDQSVRAAARLIEDGPTQERTHYDLMEQIKAVVESNREEFDSWLAAVKTLDTELQEIAYDNWLVEARLNLPELRLMEMSLGLYQSKMVGTGPDGADGVLAKERDFWDDEEFSGDHANHIEDAITAVDYFAKGIRWQIALLQGQIS